MMIKLKKLLRKWLEVPDSMDREAIREEVKEAIYWAFLPDYSYWAFLPDYSGYYTYSEYRTLAGLLKEQIDKVGDKSRNLIEEELEQRLDEEFNTEKFINSVVARINEKQIK
jgi:hypothetical protein